MLEEVKDVQGSNLQVLENSYDQGGAVVDLMIFVCSWVEENLEKLPNFWKQQNTVLVSWHGQQFFGCYVKVLFLHLIHTI
jgi:hypothetical protein